MKRRKIVLVLMTVMMMAVLLSVSASATAYEPDGSASSEYVFAAADCNRTLYVNCIDYDTGATVKSMTYYTKSGEDDLISLSIYGYDITDFTSNCGLFNKCKLTWASGTSLCTYAYIQIEYKFAALGAKTMTATVILRKSEAITLEVRHYIQKRDVTNLNYTYYSLYSSSSQVVEYYSDISTSSKNITGYHLKDGYASSISGKLTYQWVGKYKNTPSSPRTYDYDLVNTPLSEDMDSWSTYHESKQGKMDYCINRVYHIDYYYDLNEYTVSFDANGGNGVPGAIGKYYGIDVTIPSAMPERQGYCFKGWSTSKNAVTPMFLPGDSCGLNRNVTLYAVWAESRYDFSVSDLTVQEFEVFRYGVATVDIRVDNWDKLNSYRGIPIDLLFDGESVGSQTIDLSEYGVAYVTFYLNVGNSVGSHTLEVRVNWSEHLKEIDTENNRVTADITIGDADHELSVDPVVPADGSYPAGMTVITSFTVHNDSEKDVLPDGNNTVLFRAYSDDGTGRTVLCEKKWEKFVIPSGCTNLVYFKWQVPKELSGKTVYCECTVNADKSMTEQNLTNNTTLLQVAVRESGTSDTPETRYERQAPPDYAYGVSVPAERTESASWNMWVYENGAFSLKTYGLKISGAGPAISPDASCPTAVREDGKWKMRSGYGYSIAWEPSIVSLPDSRMPESDAYTDAQSVFATFPEYRYLQENGKYDTLEKIADVFCFRQNEDADGNDRIHFIPVYVADGQYTVSAVATQVWTPAGMITAVRNTVPIVIEGNIYDDYYVGN